MLASNSAKGKINVEVIQSLLMEKKEPRAKHGARRNMALSSEDANNTPLNGVIGSSMINKQTNEAITLFLIKENRKTTNKTIYAATS